MLTKIVTALTALVAPSQEHPLDKVTHIKPLQELILQYAGPFIREKAKLPHNENKRDTNLSSLTFSPDGIYLIAGYYVWGSNGDHYVGLWNMQKFACEKKLYGPQNSIYCVCTPDGNLLAVSDHTMHLWEIPSGRKKGFWRSETCGCSSGACSDDGNFLLVGETCGWSLFDIKTRKRIALGYSCTREVAYLARLGLWGWLYLGRAYIFDPLKGEIMISCSGESMEKIGSVAASPYLFLGGFNGSLMIYDLEQKKSVAVLKAHEDEITALGVSKTGDYVATGDDWGCVKLWHGRQFREICTITQGKLKKTYPKERIHCLSFSPDERFLAVGHYSNYIQIFELISRADNLRK